MNSSDILANKNITFMLMSLSTLYILGNFPYTFYYFLTRVMKKKPSDLASLFYISQCSLYLLIILKLVVYYSFNKHFQKQINHLCKRIFNCNQKIQSKRNQSSQTDSRLLEPLCKKRNIRSKSRNENK
jgi:hypothetical protein